MEIVSLIISTYNWPSALRLTLESVRRQSQLPAEVVIADDGSKDDTKSLIEEMSIRFPVPIVHVWQEDEGFQLAKIRNKAIATAKGNYIIQTDGDIILHRHFIRDHLEIAKRHYFVTGSRVLLNPFVSEKILSSLYYPDAGQLFLGSRNLFNQARISFFRLLLKNRYKQKGKYIYYVKGCNMAFWKDDLLTINGYNEEMKGWGCEDRELAVRLIKAGVKKISLKFGAIAFHLYHQPASKNWEKEQENILKETIENNIYRSPKGLDQYLNDN